MKQNINQNEIKYITSTDLKLMLCKLWSNFYNAPCGYNYSNLFAINFKSGRVSVGSTFLY